MQPVPRGLFLFRRDLRLVDNVGLNAALAACGEVVAAFVLDPRLSAGHPYYNARAFAFLAESLAELDADLRRRGGRLHLLEGDPAAVVTRLLDQKHVQAVYLNRDYTPFSLARDGAMLAICRRRGVPFVDGDDALLNAPEQILSGSGQPFQVFTAYHRAAAARPVALPAPLAEGRFATLELPDLLPLPVADRDADAAEPGGRALGLQRLETACGLVDYETTRDLPAVDGTSHLSAHLRFGTVSPREVWHRLAEALGTDHGLLRQLHWRDFFAQVAFHNPKVFGAPFHDELARVPWARSAALFDAWLSGQTGFPLVDAGMRQLAATGAMHNRVRMVAASFLVKDLHLDWQDGERAFARRLIDFDPCQNNGNWQWVAGTGCDAQPWFRVFNPWTQQEKFDPDAAYVKRWVPELAGVPAERLHALPQKGLPPGVDYPAPLVDHAIEAERAKALYEMARTP
jgi:deoxyribodipyrimidine photo-lyase